MLKLKRDSVSRERERESSASLLVQDYIEMTGRIMNKQIGRAHV